MTAWPAIDMEQGPLTLEKYSARMKLPARIVRSKNIAATILKHFDHHFDIFTAITRTASDIYCRGDWVAGRAAVKERIQLYDMRVQEAINNLHKNFQRLQPR